MFKSLNFARILLYGEAEGGKYKASTWQMHYKACNWFFDIPYYRIMSSMKGLNIRNMARRQPKYKLSAFKACSDTRDITTVHNYGMYVLAVSSLKNMI